ncbi:MAG: helix-turn-helix domain-containing protein [Candidatus Aminicenantes bacterium]|nr:helix-turn-helix domain-containing protein [Candidatus Aminicenantes bacterium]NIM83970.1 helix-turn-helix domain-containing protein [Candidatus Aminicenantes bacterium]NIN23444.1 helix-turn-helix domain-containing protein [Candidatus Aminicenantes bacterium]NIN47149.1 helix-turn-helix domain-containing protein [Candidatus Aminicenantes bacterium]NIN90073.1 helix-turn-helix domain-containing protein [Candidatus Aminicenantes bacterium]
MAFKRAVLLKEIGRRLRGLRKQLNYSLEEMAGKLGRSKSGYFKNENGITLPSLATMHHLQADLDISMDWLIFNKGPIHYQDKQPEPQRVEEDEKKTKDLENISADVWELLAYMERDRLLAHEVFVYFYKYKERKEHQGLQGVQEADEDE